MLPASRGGGQSLTLERIRSLENRSIAPPFSALSQNAMTMTAKDPVNSVGGCDGQDLE